jgi:hypothetical protein
MNRNFSARLGASLSLLALSASSAAAQGFNIEVGVSAASVPAAVYGAAASQPGTWNHFVPAVPSAAVPLNSLAGTASGVTMQVTPGPNGYNGLISFNWNNPNTTGGDERLLDDILDVGGTFASPAVNSGVTVTVSGLAAGFYEVYTYCFAPDNYLPGNGGLPWNTLVDVTGSIDPQQPVGALDWAGTFIQNETFAKHRVAVAAGQNLVIQLSHEFLTFSFASFNGLQIKPAAPPPANYCTAGTTTNACVPALTATDNPSLSAATSCILNAANIEGQKQGLIFYGIDNSGFSPLPWSPGSSSFLCVKSPTQRSGAQASGGTTAQCNGAFSLDWHTFQAANTGLIGQPWSLGAKVYAQAWFRDPPAPKTTNLSDAVEMTYVP